MIGLTPEDVPQEGMQLGNTMLPTSLVGPAEAISARQLADFRLPGGDDKMAQARMRRALTRCGASKPPRPVRRHRPRSTCPRQ